MMRNDEDTLASVIETLRKNGYTLDLNLNVTGLKPADLQIDETYRFVSTTDLQEEAVLYAISSRKTGEKGLFLNAEGVFCSEESSSFLDKIARSPHNSVPPLKTVV